MPVVVQDADSHEVLVVAYANQQALDYTLAHGIATFWSTSRNELWIKGATSGDKLELVEVRVNCEQNSLLYLVRPLGEGVCHTKDADGRARHSCYYRRIRGRCAGICIDLLYARRQADGGNDTMRAQANRSDDEIDGQRTMKASKK